MTSGDNTSTVLFFHSRERVRGPAEEKLRGIYRFARACRWNVIILEAPYSESEVRDQITAWQPVGCIVDMNESRKYFTAFSLGETPTVFLDFDDRQSRGKTFRVNHNPDAIGLLAARHLSSLGLENFAFVGYTRQWSWSEARKQSFRKHLGKLDDAGFRAFEFPAGTTASTKIRKNFIKWLADIPRPCGLLLADDGLASEVYPACARLKLKIPGDLAILGVDDNELFCGNLRPTLSSILLDFSQAGWMAAELLHRVIGNRTLSPVVTVYDPLGIAPRGSTAVKIVKSSPIAEKAKKLVARSAAAGANAGDIAKNFDCSRRLVELRFRQSTGMSLLKAIHETRLAKACELLGEADIPIGAIAQRCGYASESALKARFKKKTGMTMGEWRKKKARGVFPPWLCPQTAIFEGSTNLPCV